MSNENAVVHLVQSITAPEMQSRFAAMLPPDVKKDRFTEVVLTAIQQNPKILSADRQTLYSACITAAKRGLLPDKREGSFVIFPTCVDRKANKWVDQVSFLPMVEGVIKEFGKAGISAYAVSVYANERFRLWNDERGQHVEHETIPFGDRGARIGAFACGTKEGRTYVEAMNMAELEKTALRSKQAKEDKNGVKSRGGTWLSDPDRMEQKTVLHRLRRRMPMEGEFMDDEEIDVTHSMSEPVGPAEFGGITSNTTAPPENIRPRALQAVLSASNRSDPDQQMEPEERMPGGDDDVF